MVGTPGSKQAWVLTLTARRITVFDAETDPFEFGNVPAPFMWGFFDGEDYQEFDDTDTFVNFLRDQDAIVYAHNGGKFDLHFLLEYIEPFSDLMIINGRISKVNIGAAELRDSWNIIPAKLAAYKKDEIDYALMKKDQRDKPANRRKISMYCKSDCVYLYDLVKRFHDEHGIVLTQAGASMRAWKKIAPVAPPRTNKLFYDEFYPWYFGGRVQCFEKGIIDADFSVFDLNSAYPYAMLSEHPYSANFSRIAGYAKGADFYRIHAVSRGALPYRSDVDGLVFPDDDQRREYHVGKWEYHAALETDSLHDVEILESVTFCGHLDFAKYINKYYALRQEAIAAGDQAGQLIYKLAMNSLYGKFAANPEKYKHYQAWPPEFSNDMESFGWNFAGEFGPWSLASASLSENAQYYYNVATGASITGYVRAMLWRTMKQCGRVLYCDTDSIACIAANLSTGDGLGQWKHEGDFNRAGIGGKKLYIFRAKPGFENKSASKGVRLTEKQLWQVARGKTVKYHPIAATFSIHKEPHFISREISLTI